MARKRKVFRSAKMARRQARKRRSKISERRKKEFLWRGYTIDELKEIVASMQVRIEHAPRF